MFLDKLLLNFSLKKKFLKLAHPHRESNRPQMKTRLRNRPPCFHVITVLITSQSMRGTGYYSRPQGSRFSSLFFGRVVANGQFSFSYNYRKG